MITITCDYSDEEFVLNILMKEGIAFNVKKLCGGYQFDIDTAEYKVEELNKVS